MRRIGILTPVVAALVATLAFLLVGGGSAALGGGAIGGGGGGGTTYSVFTTTVDGLVPHVASTGKFLKDDATWASPAAGVTGTFGTADIPIGNSANATLQNFAAATADASNTLTVPVGNTEGGDVLKMTVETAGREYGYRVYGPAASSKLTVGRCATCDEGGQGMGLYVTPAGNENTRMVIEAITDVPIDIGTHLLRRLRVTHDGGLGFYETTEPGTTGTNAMLYTNSASHTLKLSNNSGYFDDVAYGASKFSTSNTTDAAATLTTAAAAVLSIGNYQCHGVAILNDTVSTDGAKCALTKLTTLAVGAGTTGAVRLDSTTANTGDAGVDHGTTFAPSVSLSVLADGSCIADATIVVTTAGNLGLQVSQNSHSTGTLTAWAGTSLVCTRM